MYDTGVFHVKLSCLICHSTHTSKQYRRYTFLQFKCVIKNAEYLLLRMRYYNIFKVLSIFKVLLAIVI